MRSDAVVVYMVWALASTSLGMASNLVLCTTRDELARDVVVVQLSYVMIWQFPFWLPAVLTHYTTARSQGVRAAVNGEVALCLMQLSIRGQPQVCGVWAWDCVDAGCEHMACSVLMRSHHRRATKSPLPCCPVGWLCRGAAAVAECVFVCVCVSPSGCLFVTAVCFTLAVQPLHGRQVACSQESSH